MSVYYHLKLVTHMREHPQAPLQYCRKNMENIIKTSAKLVKDEELETCFIYGRQMC